MNFRAVFIAIVIATGLIVSAYPREFKTSAPDRGTAGAALIRASGKCAEVSSQPPVFHRPMNSR